MTSISKKIIAISAACTVLALTGCDSDDLNISIDTQLNGTWASTCEYNGGSGYYETIDYELYNTSASILLSSYNNASCTAVVDQTLYEGTVSQTGTVILGNGLSAAELLFKATNPETDIAIEYISYFYANSYSMYEYTDPDYGYNFEFQRIY